MPLSRVAVFGGSFNPIHNGHLMAAEHAADYLGLDKVWFMPTSSSPLKPEGYGYAPKEARLEMVKAAIKGNRRFDVCNWEILDEGPSYTIDAARQFAKVMKAKPLFLVGSDAIQTYDRWKDAYELGAMSTFGILDRTRCEDFTIHPQIQDYRIVPVPDVRISASYIRDRIYSGDSVKYLVPDPVYKLLQWYGLWKKVHTN